MPRGRNSSRTEPLPPGWESQIRPRILARDDHACQWLISEDGTRCGAPARNVDHKTPVHQGGTDDDANLQALCDPHVRYKDASEGGRVAQALRPRRIRAPEPHPGIVD